MEKQHLLEAAKELNGMLGLEPPIAVDLPDEELKTLLAEAAALVTKDDTLTAVTWSVLLEVGGLVKEVEAKAIKLCNVKPKKGEKKMTEETKEKKESAVSVSSVLTSLITEGKYTKAQILEKAQCKDGRYGSHVRYLKKKGNTIVTDDLGIVSIKVV